MSGPGGAQPIHVLVYSSNARTREQVRLALGKRVHPELPELTYTDVATGPMVIQLMDRGGFDLVITRRISESVGVPVVASGGAGKLEHMAEVLLEGKADAVLAASIFHFGEYTVGDVKKFLAAKGIPVRMV